MQGLLTGWRRCGEAESDGCRLRLVGWSGSRRQRQPGGRWRLAGVVGKEVLETVRMVEREGAGRALPALPPTRVPESLLAAGAPEGGAPSAVGRVAVVVEPIPMVLGREMPGPVALDGFVAYGAIGPRGPHERRLGLFRLSRIA